MAKKVNKDEVLSEKFFAMIEEKYGEGTLSLSDRIMKLDSVSTGSIRLDMALGIGGFPRGRIIEIFGQEMSAKTTLALHTIANAQKKGIVCAFIDVEHALDVDYAKKIGVNFKKLLLSQPDSGDDALNLTEDLVETGKVGYIVIDSVSALVPKAEILKETGKELPGIQARLMSQGLRKLVPKCAKFNTAVIFINQMRDKIGVMFGEKSTTSGGNALKFYATIRIRMRVRQKIKNKKEQMVASKMIAEVVKNKVAPPFRKAEFIIRYGKGIDQWRELAQFLILIGEVEKKGSWFIFGDEKVQGGGKLRAILRKKLDYDKTYKRIIKKLAENAEGEEEEDDED